MRSALTLQRVHDNITPIIANGHVYAPNDPARRTSVAHGHLTLTLDGATVRFLGDDGSTVTFTRHAGPLA